MELCDVDIDINYSARMLVRFGEIQSRTEGQKTIIAV